VVLSDKKRLMFSIIIPAYNYADVLERLIRALVIIEFVEEEFKL